MKKIIGLGILLMAGAGHALDADSDGMDDSWELANGLNPGDPGDRNLNPDSDRLPNFGEFIHNTDPHNRDTDGDWLSDGEEVKTYGTDPTLRDTDGDTVKDFDELRYGFDPLDPADVFTDSDNDGLAARKEINFWHTDPWKWDTDGDWIGDRAEVITYGFDPNKVDTDGDGISDYDELFTDDDGDGLQYYAEINAGSDPNNPDTDGDVMSDLWEYTYGLNPSDPADTDIDADGDSFTNIQEFRLGTNPIDSTDVPAYLPVDYSESFEEAGTPSNWYSAAPDSESPWAPNCNFYPADGSCGLKAGVGQQSTVSFMARFTDGVFAFHWAAIKASEFTVFVDGAEVLSVAGGFSMWQKIDIPVADGVHEITFTHNNSAADALLSIDAVSFLSDGLSVRPGNPSCLAPPIDDSASAVAREWPFPELPHFSLATKLLQAPGDASRWFVLEQGGLVKVFDVADPANVRTYLDLSGDIFTELEGGLLSMVFDPAFPTVPEVYLVYANAANITQVSRFRLDDTDAPVSPVEEVLLTLDKNNNGHYAGDLHFGPDDMLYITLGDDAYSDRAQDTKNLYGTIIRIDVRSVPWPVPGYNLPPGNAFSTANQKCGSTTVNPDDCPEIFAWGLRNPWRFSIDDETGDIWVGDVGLHEREEINLIQMGGNYGWPCFEGSVEGPEYFQCPVPLGGLIPPVAEFSHEVGQAVVGGFVYRGSAMPERQGRYIFADLGAGPIWELVPDGVGNYTMEQISTTPTTTASYAEGADGEIYFVSYFSTEWNPGGWEPPVLGKLVPDTSGSNPAGPVIADNLADTGCVDPLDPTQPATGVIPYDINALFWSDNAVKTRYLAVPDGTTININGADDWDFPTGSVLMKNFRLNGKLIETRLLMNRWDPALATSRWEGVSYEWDDSETSATRVVGGKAKVIDGQTWLYPSSGQCDACHTAAAGGALGPETAQLNKDFHYPNTGAAENQLDALDNIGMFTSPLGAPPNALPKLADPFDGGESLDARARSYLHTNCSQCHRPGTGVPSTMDLRYQTLLSNSNACDVAPNQGDLGIGPGARLIAPGDAASSVLLERMSRRDAYGMPPVGSAIPDVQGAQLLTDWINSLDNCL